LGKFEEEKTSLKV